MKNVKNNIEKEVICDDLQKDLDRHLESKNAMAIFRRYVWIAIVVGIVIGAIVFIAICTNEILRILLYLIIGVSTFLFCLIWFEFCCFYPFKMRLTNSMIDQYSDQWKVRKKSVLSSKIDDIDQNLQSLIVEKEELSVQKELLQKEF